eukprot:5808142-Prymnesium_polylepis.3
MNDQSTPVAWWETEASCRGRGHCSGKRAIDLKNVGKRKFAKHCPGHHYAALELWVGDASDTARVDLQLCISNYRLCVVRDAIDLPGVGEEIQLHRLENEAGGTK